MSGGSYDAAEGGIERFGQERLREIAPVLGQSAVDDALATARAIDAKWEAHRAR